MHTRTLATETTRGGKTEAMGQNTYGKGVKTVAELGTRSSKRARCSWYGRPMFLRPRREINRVVHSSMTTPDIEAEIVKRSLNTCCTVPQRKARTLRLPAEILELIEQKQRLLQRWRGARRLCEKEQLSRQYKSKTAAFKRAVRAYKRGKLENLAGELEQTIACNQVKSTYAMVKRLLPVQAPPRVTECARKIDLQRGVTKMRLLLSEMHWSQFLVQSRFRWKPNASFPKPRNGYLLRRLLHTKLKMRSGQFHSCQNGKAGPCTRSGGPADQNKFGRAAVEQWKAVVGQRAQAPRSACAQTIAAAWTETATTGRVPQEDRRGGCFLTQTRKTHWGCEELENHRVAQPHWQGMGKSIGLSTRASNFRSCRPMHASLAHSPERAREMQ